MRTKKVVLFVLASFFIASSFNSCKKYDDGGLINKTEKRLVKTWKLVKYLKNDLDETSSIYISNYVEKYNEDGTFERFYNDKEMKTKSEIGTWKFEKENKLLNISGVSSIEISEASGSISSSKFNILKLDNEELWYSYENGGDKHEFQLSNK